MIPRLKHQIVYIFCRYCRVRWLCFRPLVTTSRRALVQRVELNRTPDRRTTTPPFNQMEPVTDILRATANIVIRTTQPNTQSAANPDTITFSRTAFIAIITTSIILTTVSIAILTTIAILSWRRRQRRQATSAWDRRSRYANRISQLRREVDNDYQTRYSGGLSSVAENPEIGRDSPKQLLMPEPKVYEVPATPAPPRAKRMSRMNLFFDHGVGLWLQRK